MSQPKPARRVIALIAAYVVALQALLLPLSVAAGGPLQTSLCSETSNGAPVKHDGGCPCAAGCGMQCHMPALAGPPQIAIADLPVRSVGMNAAPVFDPVVRIADRGPHSQRAPPAT